MVQINDKGLGIRINDAALKTDGNEKRKIKT